MLRQSETETLDEQNHYRFCCRIISLALEGWENPFIAAFYYHCGRHSDKLICEWRQRPEYAKTRA